MIALTSLSPSPETVARQAHCLASWRALGLEVCALQPSSEIAALRLVYPGMAFVGVVPSPAFDRPCVPINTFVGSIASMGHPALVINADLELRLTPAALARLASLADTGLPYLTRIDHDAGDANPAPELRGIDALIVHPRFAQQCDDSFLALGQPWWDYWLPEVAVQRGEQLYTTSEPACYHLRHPKGWDEANWHRCASEFARVAGLDVDEEEEFAHSELSLQVMARIRQHTATVAA